MPRDERPSSRSPRRDSERGTGRPARPARPRRDNERGAGRPARPRRDDERGARSTGRPARPARRFDRDERPSSRGPRRDDERGTGRPARPARRFDRDERPSSRGPRRDDERGARSTGRPARPARRFDRDERSPSRGPRRDDERGARGTGRPARRFDRDERPSSRGPRRDDERRPRRADAPDTRTAAQRKSDEVKSRTGGRRYGTDPYPPTQHTRERWQDEGSVRQAATSAVKRGSKSAREDDRVQPVSVKNVDVQVVNKIRERLGAGGETRAVERLARALHAFEAHRYAEARKLVMPLLSQLQGIALVHEVAGLSMYRLGRWMDAAEQLEIARGVSGAVCTNHPVLADCYRALRRYEKVTALWEELKAASPHPALLAEGRIVAAGALADQGELQAAVRLMTHGTSDPHKVQEHHLREWYVLADLYDRAGDVAAARRLFSKIQSHDATFADVADRLGTLGQ